MGDYCDSPAFKSHPLFTKDPSALQIMIYDDVEVTNPLGSKTKIHKIGSFIFCNIVCGNNGLSFCPQLYSTTP